MLRLTYAIIFLIVFFSDIPGDIVDDDKSVLPLLSGGGGGVGGNDGLLLADDMNDANSLVSSASWSEESLYLKEFIHKTKLPRLVRIVKGQYLSLGVPSLSNPSPHQTVLLVNLGKRKRLLAHCVKFKDNRKISTVGQKLAIPATYDGFFEILSEDGRSVKCIESVAELCKRFPDSVLVRENIRAFVSKSDDVDTIKDKSRVIAEGESLILVGEVLGVKGKSHNRFLRCFDCNGENVYLPFDLKGKFSAIAKEDNISGVHTAHNLLNKRLPVMARLAHGSTPAPVHGARANSFVPEMRMLTTIEEDYIVGLTLSKECHLIPIPLPALLKVQTASNHEKMSNMMEFERLLERCQEMATDILDRITIHDVSYARDLRLHGAEKHANHNLNHNNNNNNNNNLHMATYQRRKNRKSYFDSSSTSGASKGAPGDEYDEIEQIYDYVRGFAPLPRSAKGWRYENVIAAQTAAAAATASKRNTDSDEPPEPPPIETIPGRHQQHSPMEFSTPPTTPPISAVWDSVASSSAPPPEFHNHDSFGSTHRIYDEKYMTKSESKKRQRRVTTASGGGGVVTTPTPPHDENSHPFLGNAATRFIKSATHRQVGQKHKFFRQRLGVGGKESSSGSGHSPMMSMTLSRSNIYSPHPPKHHHQQQHHHHHHQSSSPSSFFHLRYKSLTNLAQAEYDTLESSNSGGKTSGDSGGSRTLPEKRSRKLSRPKSLTNLVWGNSSSSRLNGSGSPMVIPTDHHPPPQTQPAPHSHHQDPSGKAVYTQQQQQHRQQQQQLMHHGNKLGSNAGKKLGTLYL